MIDVAHCVGHVVLPPTPKEILGKYLDMFAAETEEEIKKQEPVWEEYGCSLSCDGWTSSTKMFIINFIVYSAREVVYRQK